MSTKNVAEKLDQDLTVRVSKSVKAKVYAEAKKKKIPVSQFLREMISDKMNQKKIKPE